jgi:hypothetical protein
VDDALPNSLCPLWHVPAPFHLSAEVPPHRRGSLLVSVIRGRYGIETTIGLWEQRHSPKRGIGRADPQTEGLAVRPTRAMNRID